MARLPKPRTWLAAAALVLASAEDGTCTVEGDPACGSAGRSRTDARSHHWPHARGHAGSYGVAALKGPGELSRPWHTWFPGETRFRSILLCGPLIDDASNLYVTTLDAIYKLTAEGRRVWDFRTNSSMADCPSLMGSRLFGADKAGHVFALDLETGRLEWMRKYAEGTGDTSYVESYDGVVVYGGNNSQADSGALSVFAVSAADGALLWEFAPDNPVWNLMPVFPRDGTVVFQDCDATAYRLGLRNGSLIWKAGGNHTGTQTWTDGGCVLGPNGVVYAVSSKATSNSHHSETGGGLHAYRLEDGSLLWEQDLQRPLFSFPAVGRLAGRSDLSVVVGVGSNAYTPWQVMLLIFLAIDCWAGLMLAVAWSFCRMCRGGQKMLLKRLLVGLALGAALALVMIRFYQQGFFVPIRPFEAEVIAFDAETGEQQWEHRLQWPHSAAAGDEEGFLERLRYTPHRTTCMPAAFSSPAIDAAGVVYVGYQSGMLLGLRDADEDGMVAEDEVTRFDAKAGFMHSGAAFAPGMFAVTSCDSLHVWKT